MGTVFRYRDVKIIIRTKDHDPPHVHVIRGDAEAVIEIISREILHSRGFTRNDIKRITEFLTRQEEALMEAWNAIHEEED